MKVRSGEGGQDLLGPLCRFLGGERGWMGGMCGMVGVGWDCEV